MFASGRDGNLDMIGIYAGEELAGFFAVRRFQQIRYIAFFAVRAQSRCQGIGSRALEQLMAFYADCQIVVEFEAPSETAENAHLRQRRRDFYLRCGFLPTGWYNFYDGAEFEIACTRHDFDIRLYEAFIVWLNSVVDIHMPTPYRKDE